MKEIKKNDTSGIGRESDEYIDGLIDRAVDKAIEDQKLHVVRVRKRKLVLSSAAVLLLLFSFGAGYLFQSPGLQDRSVRSYPTHEVVTTPASTAGVKTDKPTNKGIVKVDSKSIGVSVGAHRQVRPMAHGALHQHRDDALDETLNSIDDKDMQYVDCYEIDDIPEY
jgi:hypothetical protein